MMNLDKKNKRRCKSRGLDHKASSTSVKGVERQQKIKFRQPIKVQPRNTHTSRLSGLAKMIDDKIPSSTPMSVFKHENLNTSIFPTSPTNFSSAGCNMSMHKSTAFGNFGRLTKITSYSGSKNRKLATGTKVIDPQKMEEFNSAQPISVRPSRIPQHSLQYIQQLQKQAWGTMKRLHFSKYKREKSSSQFGFTHKVDVKRILETNDEEKPEKSQNKIL